MEIVADKGKTHMLIREAIPTDADVISEIGKQSFIDAFAHLFNRSQEMFDYLDTTYKPERLAESITKPNNQFFIAYQNDRPVGFVKMKRASFHKTLTAAKQSELQKIYVLTEVHGSGAAQGLINAVIEESKKINTDVLWLDVHIANEKAKRFYSKNGFEKCGDHTFVIGTQTFYYDVFALPLNQSK